MAAHTKILLYAELLKLGERYGKSVAQICIRYVVQKGVVTLPKSTHRDRILQNADVDFEIEAQDMAIPRPP